MGEIGCWDSLSVCQEELCSTAISHSKLVKISGMRFFTLLCYKHYSKLDFDIYSEGLKNDS